VAVEKLDLSENRPKRGDQKCIGDRRKSFIGHPDATHFRRKFCERVFQQLQAITQLLHRPLPVNLREDLFRPDDRVGDGQMVAGTFGPAGYCASFRAAKIAAAISRARLRPSSIGAEYQIRLVFAIW